VLPADVADRLIKFKGTLLDEVHEIDAIVALANDGGNAADIAVAIADLLGDIVVYCRSENQNAACIPWHRSRTLASLLFTHKETP
jgi:hypothetical protein